MALIVDNDSYVTELEAEEYISKNYVSTDPLRKAWAALTDEDKEVYLRVAAKTVDALALKGKKCEVNQKMQFPRYYDSKSYQEYLYPEPEDYDVHGRYYYQITVPNNVKYAQIETAIFNCDSKANKRIKLQSQGVKSFSIGDLSETYGAGKSLYSNEAIIKAPKAIELMRPFMGGTYNVI